MSNDNRDDFREMMTMWQRENAGEAQLGVPTAAEIIDRAQTLDRSVRSRDRVESLVAVVVLPVFLWLAVIVPSPVSKAGALVIALGCVVTPLRLWWARRRQPRTEMTLAQSIDRELAWVDAQTRLLRSVTWWYLAPFGIGSVLFVGGGALPWWAKVLYAGIVFAFYAYLAVLNRRAAEQHLAPHRIELRRWRESLRQTMER